MEKIYKLRAYPNDNQKKKIAKNFDGVRVVYNHYLYKQMQRYQEGLPMEFSVDMCKDLTLLKKTDGFLWLKECDSVALQQAIRNLDRAYKNYFREMKKPHYIRYSKDKLEYFSRIGKTPTLYDSAYHPKFKDKNNYRKSYTTTNYFGKTQSKPSIEIINGKVKIPTLGWIKIRDNRDIEGRILHATIEETASKKYYIYLCCTNVEVNPFPKTGKQIGIDLGIREYMCYFSDGTKEPIPEYYKKSLDKIKRLNRELDRKTEGGANWEKTRVKLAKAYEKLVSQKKDYLNKLTTSLVKSNDLICIEDLDVEGMIKNVQGYNVFKSNKRAAIKACGLGEFISELEYKTEWYKKELFKANRNFPSSRLCHICGYRNDQLEDVGIKHWICPKCGVEHDRDINAAINLLNEGLRACSQSI